MKTKIVYYFFCIYCKIQRESVNKDRAEKKVCFKCQEMVDAEINQPKLDLWLKLKNMVVNG